MIQQEHRQRGQRVKQIQGIEFQPGSREELLPGFSSDFPYIATRAELDRYAGRFVPWHWHRTVEIFYMESGVLEYHTPGGRLVFPAGSGGMVNSNVLHMTKAVAQTERNVQLLHIFDPALLAGVPGSRIAQKYIAPIVIAPQIELIPLYPQDPAQAAILRRILDVFQLSEDRFGYEIRLREALSEIWIGLLKQCSAMLNSSARYVRSSDEIKEMMVFAHEHYQEHIAISELAASAFLSERECFRVFHNCLHMTPAEYIKEYRIQMACRMLEQGRESITTIGGACGFGSSSYFAQVFRLHTGYTPSEYRQKWRDHDR